MWAFLGAHIASLNHGCQNTEKNPVNMLSFCLRWPTLIFSENSVLENFLILKRCIFQLHNSRKK